MNERGPLSSGAAPPAPEAGALERWPLPALLLDGSERVRWGNRAAARLFGREPEELVGAAYVALIEEERLPSRPETTRTAHVAGFDPSAVPDEVRLVVEGGVLVLLGADLRDLGRRVTQLSLLIEIASILHSTTDLDKVLRVILTGVTAGKGLQFNRAFLLLVNESRGLLEGKMGLGPADAEEAYRIWSGIALEDLTLRELLLRAAVGRPADARIHHIVERLSVPLDRTDHILVQGLHGREVFHAAEGRPEAAELQAVLGSADFAMVPIRTWERPIGVLLADNVVTGARVRPEDRDVLRAFADQAGIAIEKAYLYDELQNKVDELEETRRALIENQTLLLQAERLRAVGEVAARVAHEIRNPLVAIGGFATRLIRRKGSGDPDLPDLRVIAEETARLEAILREVLDYAQPSLGLECAMCRLEDLVEQTRRIVEEPLSRRGIRLRVETGGAPPEVAADLPRLRQVLVNLVRNAGEASPDGSEVLLRVQRTDEHIAFEVTDSGPGVPPEDRERIFEPFYTTKHGGSGLGLAVARRIAQEHGGSLRCVPAEGGRFVLRLPLPRPEETAT